MNVVTAHQLFPCITHGWLVRHLLPCTATASAISYRRVKRLKDYRSYSLRILVYRTCLAKFFIHFHPPPQCKFPPISYVIQLYKLMWSKNFEIPRFQLSPLTCYFPNSVHHPKQYLPRCLQSSPHYSYNQCHRPMTDGLTRSITYNTCLVFGRYQV